MCCSTPQVTWLILDFSLSKFFFLCFAQHIELLSSFLTCLNCLNLSCFVLNTSTRSAHCSVVSGSYLNTPTFVRPVLVSFYPLSRSNFLLLMFHSPKLLSISTFFSLLSIGFLSCYFLYNIQKADTFVIAFLSVYLTSTQLRTPSSQGMCTVNTYIYKLNARLDSP